jgi:HPr kinase/phosphorylase
MYSVKELFSEYQTNLALSLLCGEKGLKRPIKRPEVNRPGLSLTGNIKNYAATRILIFGKVEIAYLNELSAKVRKKRLESILTDSTPAVIVARQYRPPKELQQLCEINHIPLFSSKLTTMSLLSKLVIILNEEFAPSTTVHGSLIEVFGVGVLIQGESSIGKSEAALGLIERGHRLITDDVVHIKKKEDSYLLGSGPELTRHLMEIRGIGIINVAHLYGAVCVRPKKSIDLVVALEKWDGTHFYDRVGLKEKTTEILDLPVPFNIIPVKPGRDVVLLIETTALNHRLKMMGYHSAKEFNKKLLETIAKKKSKSCETDT